MCAPSGQKFVLCVKLEQDWWDCDLSSFTESLLKNLLDLSAPLYKTVIERLSSETTVM